MATQSNYDDYDEMAGVEDAIAAQKAAADQEDDTSALKAYSPAASENKPAVKKPKPAAKPAAKTYTSNYSNEGSKYKAPASTSTPTDVTQMSVNDRLKAAKNKSREGTTDSRSVNERFRSAFGFKSGGAVSSASRRADGIATKGKTRGKMC
jgi:hypothetical protein